MKPNFSRQFTELQKEVIGRLAQIEQEDADACAGCGGEDCVCCEIYHDRKLWVSPEELFAEDNEEYFRYGEDEEDEAELLSTVYEPEDFHFVDEIVELKIDPNKPVVAEITIIDRRGLK